MPTIAFLNGHTFGAGVFLALACDYRIQNASKGFLCLPEVDLGVPIPVSIAAMMKAKLPNLNTYRDLVLTGKRLSAADAVAAGVVDATGKGVEDAVAFARSRALLGKSAGGGGVVGVLKEDLYRDVLAAFDRESENVAWRAYMDQERVKRAELLAREVEAWEGKAKL